MDYKTRRIRHSISRLVAICTSRLMQMGLLVCMITSCDQGPANTKRARINKQEDSTEVESKVNTTIDTNTHRNDSVSIDTIQDLTQEFDSTSSLSTRVVQPRKKVSPKKPVLRGKMNFGDTAYSFDTITAGDVVERTFTFINTGKAPVNIKDANVTCGCTYPSYSFLPIAPGDSSQVNVTYNSVGKQGLQEATITINSDALPSTVQLTLKGYVVPQPKD